MEFEWDDSKARQNLEKHGIDFADLPALWDQPVLERRSQRRGEPRWMVLGSLGGRSSSSYTPGGESAAGSSRQERLPEMSERRITRRAVGDRRKGKTDWERLERMSEEEIVANAASDPDSPLWTEEELRSAELVMPTGAPKVPVSIRLDPEVLDYFKAEGPGYQSRISAVLRSYVRARRSG